LRIKSVAGVGDEVLSVMFFEIIFWTFVYLSIVLNRIAYCIHGQSLMESKHLFTP